MHLQVSDIPGKGKGLIVTEDVPKGTLVLAEKAFAFASCDDFKGNLTTVDQFGIPAPNFKTLGLLIIETIQKLQRNPQQAKMLYSLYAGDFLSRSKDQLPPYGDFPICSNLPFFYTIIIE